MSLLDRYPINVSELVKGQLLTIEQLMEILRKKPGDGAKWAFAVLALREFIEEHTDFTLKSTVEGLRILTDSEASAYLHRRFHGYLGAAMRRYHRNALVESANLAPQEKVVHERNLLNESRYVTSMIKVSKQIATDAYRRRTPGLPSPKEG